MRFSASAGRGSRVFRLATEIPRSPPMRTHFESILLLSLAACAAAPSDSAAAAGVRPWDAPPLARATVVRDAHSGRRLELEELFDELAEADAVFLGEEHTDETTHRVELAVYEGLLARRGDRVVLAMEMFQHDAQPLLDDYLAGRIDEATFLEGAEPWGNYWAAYRPLIERARAGGPGIERARAGGPGLRVIGSNYPRSLTRKVAMGGADALAALDESERALVPAELLANSTAYHRRVDNAIRGHIGMMGPRDPDDPRLYTTQTLWDNAMGEACAKVLDEIGRASCRERVLRLV